MSQFRLGNDEMKGIMKERLSTYLNSRVSVHYGGSAVGYSDVGTLTCLSDVWIELTKEKGERILIPVVSIRLIKLLNAPKLSGDATSLLRPYEGMADRIEE